MSKELRKYLQKEKAQFDHREAPAGLWDKIDLELDKRVQKPAPKLRKISRMNWLRAAAVLLLTFGLGYSLATFVSNPSSDVSWDLAELEKQYQLDPQIVQVENYYQTQIVSLSDQLTTYSSIDGNMVVEFLKEHEVLDSVYNELKIRLYQGDNSKKVMDLMTLNLQMRIRILEKQLNILERINTRKKTNKNGKNII